MSRYLRIASIMLLGLALLLMGLTAPAMASKLYILAQGLPWDTQSLPYGGSVKIGNDFNGWSMYQISGTAAQLTAIKALTGTVPIVTVTENGAFMTDNNSKSGTSGNLWGMAPFSASRAVLSGDTLNLTITLSIS